jgi:uncharacterized protein YjbJ (UPF0337 family)
MSPGRSGSWNPKENDSHGGTEMSDDVRNTDDAKGRVKEAAGDLTGDDDLKREGKVDQATGKVKDGIEKASDKIKDALKRD